MFFDTQKHVYFESVFNALYIEIKHICYESFLWTKYTVQNMRSFFFR